MTNTNTVTLEHVHNHTAELAEVFLSGKIYSEHLSEKVFVSFEPDRRICFTSKHARPPNRSRFCTSLGY